ncbi:hypothetical protein X975_16952, partial [Stegodyphus mimosarum]
MMPCIVAWHFSNFRKYLGKGFHSHVFLYSVVLVTFTSKRRKLFLQNTNHRPITPGN